MTVHTLSVLVENRPGVLARISGLFARRGFNIDSLAVGETEDPRVSRMTIVVSVDTAPPSAVGPAPSAPGASPLKPLEQITKQLHKLINILRIAELPHDDSVERELALIKVGVGAGKRAEVLEIVEIFRAKVVDVDPDALTVEATGTPEKIEAFTELLRPYQIVELARTGRIALGRGARGLKPPNLRPVSVYDRTAS